MLQTLSARAANAIAYDKTGSGPPMLFIHGLTYDRRMWDPLVSRLSGDHTCIAIDLPGHGKSGDLPSYDLLAVTRDVYDAFRAIDDRAPIVVGHSMGALDAVAYAALYPVAGLVTSDFSLRNGAFIDRLRGMSDALHSPAFPGIWRAIESELGIDLIPQPQRALVESASNPRQDVVLGYWREGFESIPGELQLLLNKFARNIGVPFCAIFGDEPEPDYREWLQPLVPHCDVVVFPNAGHFPHLVDIDRFAGELRAVAGQSAPR